MLLGKWSALWGLPGLEEGIRVSFSPHMQRSLGRCAPERGRISLHPALRTAPPERLAAVLCHEAAHVAAFVLYGRSVRPHGPEWAGLVSQVGFTPATREPALEARRKALPEEPSRLEYEHRCPVCQAVRLAKRPVPRWRCAECVAAGLNGEMTITRRSDVSHQA
jgi:SprT protein